MKLADCCLWQLPSIATKAISVVSKNCSAIRLTSRRSIWFSEYREKLATYSWRNSLYRSFRVFAWVLSRSSYSFCDETRLPWYWLYTLDSSDISVQRNMENCLLTLPKRLRIQRGGEKHSRRLSQRKLVTRPRLGAPLREVLGAA